MVRWRVAHKAEIERSRHFVARGLQGERGWRTKRGHLYERMGSFVGSPNTAEHLHARARGRSRPRRDHGWLPWCRLKPGSSMILSICLATCEPRLHIV